MQLFKEVIQLCEYKTLHLSCISKEYFLQIFFISAKRSSNSNCFTWNTGFFILNCETFLSWEWVAEADVSNATFFYLLTVVSLIVSHQNEGVLCCVRAKLKRLQLKSLEQAGSRVWQSFLGNKRWSRGINIFCKSGKFVKKLPTHRGR